jgi:tartrate dehydratase alpha subunit/fumarate hydratase class I-like protein
MKMKIEEGIRKKKEEGRRRNVMDDMSRKNEGRN